MSEDFFGIMNKISSDFRLKIRRMKCRFINRWLRLCYDAHSESVDAGVAADLLMDPTAPELEAGFEF